MNVLNTYQSYAIPSLRKSSTIQVNGTYRHTSLRSDYELKLLLSSDLGSLIHDNIDDLEGLRMMLTEDINNADLSSPTDKMSLEPVKITNVFIDTIIIPKRLSDMTICAEESLNKNNARGNSDISESISIDYLERYFNATNIITEMDVCYFIDYKNVDFLCTIDKSRIGLSVTRAMRYPDPDLFTLEDARHLIRKKLSGLIISRNATVEKHSFFKSILHVFCQTKKISYLLKEAFDTLDDWGEHFDLKGIVILLLTICSDIHIYIYINLSLE